MQFFYVAGIISFMELTLEDHKINGLLDPEAEEMIKAGIHMGHAKSKNHPAMRPYLFGIRNNISVIDVFKTKEKLTEALEFLKNLSSQNGLILFVGTRPASRTAIKEAAEETSMPYVTERWIGVTITNFKVISQRVVYMERLEQEKVTGEFEKYTKKEKMLRENELNNLRKSFDGLRRLKKLPDALFVVDVLEDATALREAKRKNIPVVALADTNVNVDLIDWPIPSSDDALPAIRYMVQRIKNAILEGKKSFNAKPPAENGSQQ